MQHRLGGTFAPAFLRRIADKIELEIKNGTFR
jgi:hypothetical protein